jgi:hypothetical protein
MFAVRIPYPLLVPVFHPDHKTKFASFKNETSKEIHLLICDLLEYWPITLLFIRIQSNEIFS